MSYAPIACDDHWHVGFNGFKLAYGTFDTREEAQEKCAELQAVHPPEKPHDRIDDLLASLNDKLNELGDGEDPVGVTDGVDPSDLAKLMARMLDKVRDVPTTDAFVHRRVFGLIHIMMVSLKKAGYEVTFLRRVGNDE